MSTVTTCTCGHLISEHSYSDSDTGCDLCECTLDLGELIDKYAKEVADRTEQNLQDMKEIAQLKADRENAYKEIREMNIPMPCGHLARYAVNGEEGTQYCCMCDREALMTASEVAANVLSKTVDCVQLLREVDNRVPGLLYDHYDENTVSLGVRINNAITELDKVNNQ